MMPVRLRGHHFLCVLTFRGEGYTSAFTANMSDIVTAIGNGVPVMLIEGPDAICDGFTEDCRRACDHDCSARATLNMDIQAVSAVATLLQRRLDVPSPLTKPEIAFLRTAYKAGTIRSACKDCSWKDLCDSIADNNFAGVRL